MNLSPEEIEAIAQADRAQKQENKGPELGNLLNFMGSADKLMSFQPTPGIGGPLPKRESPGTRLADLMADMDGRNSEIAAERKGIRNHVAGLPDSVPFGDGTQSLGLKGIPPTAGLNQGDGKTKPVPEGLVQLAPGVFVTPDYMEQRKSRKLNNDPNQRYSEQDFQNLKPGDRAAMNDLINKGFNNPEKTGKGTDAPSRQGLGIGARKARLADMEPSVRQEKLFAGLDKSATEKLDKLTPDEISAMGADGLEKKKRVKAFSEQALVALGELRGQELSKDQLDTINAAGREFIKTNSAKKQARAISKIEALAGEMGLNKLGKELTAKNREFDTKLYETETKAIYAKLENDIAAGNTESFDEYMDKSIRHNKKKYAGTPQQQNADQVAISRYVDRYQSEAERLQNTIDKGSDKESIDAARSQLSKLQPMLRDASRIYDNVFAGKSLTDAFNEVKNPKKGVGGGGGGGGVDGGKTTKTESDKFYDSKVESSAERLLKLASATSTGNRLEKGAQPKTSARKVISGMRNFTSAENKDQFTENVIDKAIEAHRIAHQELKTSVEKYTSNNIRMPRKIAEQWEQSNQMVIWLNAQKKKKS